MKFKLFLFSMTLGLAIIANAQTMDWICSPGTYSEISYLGNNLFKVRNNSGKTGLIDAEGNIVIDIRYDSITPFVENKALLLDKQGKRLLGIINNNGEMVKDLSSSEYYVTKYPKFKEGRLPFANKKNLCGYLNERGEVSIEPSYYMAAPFQDGIAAVQYLSTDFGLINKGGKSAIISNTEYPFISSPVKGFVFAITKSRKGGNALKICRIDGVKLKDEKTLENGMNIWLGDDFTTVECQKGNRYYIDDQWRICGSNTNNQLPEIIEETQSFHLETSKILGKSNVEGGMRITYLGNPIVHNVFPQVFTYDDYAIVHSKDGSIGVLRLNKSAAVDIKAPTTPIVFYHNQPQDILLDVDLKAVNPDKLHWYRNNTGYLTHSSLECNNGKYQLRITYFQSGSTPNELTKEDIDIAFTYDGLDWMHHTVTLESIHKKDDRFEISISGNEQANKDGICKLTINIKSLNGPANGLVTIPGVTEKKTFKIDDGQSESISFSVQVPANSVKKYSYTVNITEEGCPPYVSTLNKTLKGDMVLE